MKNKKFTEKSTLAEILENPKNQKILEKFNVPCLTCPFAQLEMNSLKLKEIAGAYGIDLKSLLKELNKE